MDPEYRTWPWTNVASSVSLKNSARVFSILELRLFIKNIGIGCRSRPSVIWQGHEILPRRGATSRPKKLSGSVQHTSQNPYAVVVSRFCMRVVLIDMIKKKLLLKIYLIEDHLECTYITLTRTKNGIKTLWWRTYKLPEKSNKFQFHIRTDLQTRQN